MPSTNTTSAPSNTLPNPCRGNKDPQTHLKDITTLSHHLTTHPPKTPQAILYFITTFHRLSTTLPFAARNGKNQDSTHHPSTATNNVLNKIKSTYTSMLSLLPTTTSPALLDPHEPRKTLSHEEIHNFVRDFSLDLPSSSLSPYSSSILSKPVVAVALPSGTLMALACVAVSTYYTLAPMTPLCGKEQFRADVERVGAKAVLVAKEDVERLGLGLGDKEAGWVGGNGIRVFEVEHSEKGNTFNVSLLNCHEGNDSGTEEKDKCGDVETVRPTPNTADDIAILLFTSGTSGTKKLVPIPVHTLIVGAAFVIDSWGLSQDDTCLNMMPLYHIGGLIRNLFAPLLSSGSTICCPSFDPTLFFDLLNSTQTHTKSPTWYYASPSMHTAILSESVHQQDALQHSRIRLICNAAGGLLPTLATQLHETFNCTVLPSYGMTECMPIASPPLSYNLSRSGTSGIPVGVEVSIQDERNVVLAPNVTGNICVRGGAVFPGYLVDVDDGSLDTSCFSSSSSSSFTSSDSESESESESEYEPECWFSTGDTGYLDEDGYLYITGRTKEIINRGGEIISPFEVEESVISASNNPDSPLYDRVAECVAFSVPHAVLQEVVGIGLVVKSGRMRPSLRDVNDAVRGSLHSAKWPVVVVYMDAVPKAKGKVVRIGLSERLGMSEVDQGGSCYYEAECPAADADVKTKIPMKRCEVDCGFVSGKIKEVYAGLGSTAGTEDGNVDVLVRTGEDGMPHAYVFGQHGIEDGNDMAKKNAVLDLKTRLRDEIHGYLIPTSIAFIPSTIGIPRQNDGSIDETALRNLVLASQHQSRRPGTGMETSTGDSITESIIEIFAQVLSCSAHSLDSSTDFFAAGGDSLGAGRLLSLLRRRFKLRLSIETLFSNSSVCDIARLVEEQLHQQQQQEQDETSEKTNTMEDDNSTQTPSTTKTHSSTNPLVLLLHLLPLTLIYPLRVALWWTLFLYGMSELPRRSTLSGEIHGRLLLLILIMVACTITVRTIMPIVGILVKWIVIGRHKEGVYAMWGGYHSRWWFVQKVVQVCGKGIFNTTAWSRTLYYRLLGARIGKNAVIHETAQLGEYDLIEIGDDVILDKRCICRPFAAERNTTMLLSRISIGRGSTVGLGSVIAPGAVLPAETCIGANSSSWEMEDAGEQNRDLVTVNMSSPHWLLRLLVVEPVAILAWIARRGPWVAGLIGLVQSFPKTIYADHVEATSRWYTNLTRIGFHFVARIAGDTLGPITLFLFVVLVKRILDSRFVCGPVTSNMGPMKNRSQMQKLRRALLERLVPEGDLGKVAALFGSHYEIVSVLVRMLGGRVGQRVYWPGVGPSMQDFELLDVGNDVVFGSRSHLVTSDQMGSAGITLADGCMVADRAVVQPGTTVGENAVLGSGVLTRRNASYPADSVWVGSKGGECIRLQHNQSRDDDKNSEKGDKDTTSSTPFGRAFYQGKADYFVLSLPWIIIYSLVTTISVSLYWNLSTILSVKVLAITLHIEPIGFHKHTWYRPISIFALMTGSISLILTLQSLFALACVVAAKWALMGHRSPGSYDWDKSSYCQRWQILLTIERLRRNCYGGSGILGLLTGTYYTVLYFRALGARIGSNVALFANGKPSLLFTEPDLLTLGDRVTVDNASLVSHINSKGRFKLNRLEVRDRSVLRTGSRLLSGASVGEDACLLEHTLVMAGDYVEAGETCQGWPAGVFDKKRV